MDEINMFAQRLREARMKAGLSQAELSRQTGVAPATLSSYEVSDSPKKPTMEKVILIAKALNVSLDWLCGLTDSLQVETEEKELKIDCELFFRVLAKFTVDSPYKAINIKKLSDVFPKERKELIISLTQNYPILASEKVMTFVDKLKQLDSLRKDNTLDQGLFDMCVEQLILKTVHDIEELDDLPY